jgi:3-methyladenine DNA glycosylase AlkD
VADDVLERLTAAFETNRDRVRAPQMAAYMRDQFPFLGIPTPERRALSRAVIASTPKPSERDLTRILRACWALDEREYQYFACDYVGRYVHACSARFVRELRFAITHKSWWDSVDALAPSVGALVVAHPRLVATMDAWIDERNRWLVRVAIIHQLRHKQHTDAERLFAYCTRRADHPDFFVRKAIGWALREYSKTAPDAVRHYVTGMGDRLSPLSRREALKRIVTEG